MPDFTQLHGKKFAIILVDDDGTEDGEWIVLNGIASWRNGQLFVNRGEVLPEFPVPDDTLDRIKAVAADTKDILEGADYSILLTVGPLPKDIDRAKLISSGFTWPEKSA